MASGHKPTDEETASWMESHVWWIEEPPAPPGQVCVKLTWFYGSVRTTQDLGYSLNNAFRRAVRVAMDRYNRMRTRPCMPR